MITGIIFDLGHTLLYLDGDWRELAQTGAEAMADWYFKKKRIKLDQAGLVETFLAERAAAREQAEQSQTEIVAETCLIRALDKIEAPSKAKAQVMIEAAIKIYFEGEQAAWQPYPEAIETLKTLKAQNYRLGLYSNATDDALVQRLINENRLRSLLTITLSSAGYGWRKPRPEAFQVIARRWNLLPEEIVVVGDTLNADVLGAQNVGMKSILVTMQESPSNDQHRHIQPTATASRLSELPQLIADL